MGSHQEERPDSCNALNPNTHLHTNMPTHTHRCTRIPFIFLLLPHAPLSSVLSDQTLWKEASQADVLLLGSQRAWETDGGIKREGERGLLPLLLSHQMPYWPEMQCGCSPQVFISYLIIRSCKQGCVSLFMPDLVVLLVWKVRFKTEMKSYKGFYLK